MCVTLFYPHSFSREKLNTESTDSPNTLKNSEQSQSLGRRSCSLILILLPNSQCYIWVRPPPTAPREPCKERRVPAELCPLCPAASPALPSGPHLLQWILPGAVTFGLNWLYYYFKKTLPWAGAGTRPPQPELRSSLPVFSS